VNGKTPEQIAKAERDAAIEQRSATAPERGAATEQVNRCRVRLTVLAECAGESGVALWRQLTAVDATVLKASKDLEVAIERCESVRQEVTAAEEKRREHVAAAARGEATSAKNLKQASSNLSDAKDVLEVAEMTVTAARQNLENGKLAVDAVLDRGILMAVHNAGKRRLEALSNIQANLSALFAAQAEYAAVGQHVRNLFGVRRAAGRSGPQTVDLLAVELDGDARKFLQQFTNTVPTEIYSAGQMNPPVRHPGDYSDVERERSAWGALSQFLILPAQ